MLLIKDCLRNKKEQVISQSLPGSGDKTTLECSPHTAEEPPYGSLREGGRGSLETRPGKDNIRHFLAQN